MTLISKRCANTVGNPASTPPRTSSGLREQFLAGMRRTAATVTVVTTEGAAGRHGTTVSSMAPVAADGAAPTLLICLNIESQTTAAILGNRWFTVNILSDSQSRLAEVFAGHDSGLTGNRRFDAARWLPMASGMLRLEDALASFDCSLQHNLLVSTHQVLVGSVREVWLAGGLPLLRTNRAYCSVNPQPDQAG